MEVICALSTPKIISEDLRKKINNSNNAKEWLRVIQIMRGIRGAVVKWRSTVTRSQLWRCRRASRCPRARVSCRAGRWRPERTRLQMPDNETASRPCTAKTINVSWLVKKKFANLHFKQEYWTRTFCKKLKCSLIWNWKWDLLTFYMGILLLAVLNSSNIFLINNEWNLYLIWVSVVNDSHHLQLRVHSGRERQQIGGLQLCRNPQHAFKERI